MKKIVFAVAFLILSSSSVQAQSEEFKQLLSEMGKINGRLDKLENRVSDLEVMRNAERAEKDAVAANPGIPGIRDLAGAQVQAPLSAWGSSSFTSTTQATSSRPMAVMYSSGPNMGYGSGMMGSRTSSARTGLFGRRAASGGCGKGG